jgi:TRAP-type C4-dicarboxylate transport system permease small subunit
LGAGFNPHTISGIHLDPSLSPDRGEGGVKQLEFATMLSKFEKFNRRLSGWLEWIGVIGLLVMMFFTCIDVFLTKFFTLPMQGAIDVVMFSQLIAISFALATTLILNRHIQVDIYISSLPRRIQGVIDSIASLIGFAFFIIVVWQLYGLGHSFQTAGEKSMSQLRVSLFPFPYAVALGSIPVCLVFLQRLLSSLVKVVKG